MSLWATSLFRSFFLLCPLPSGVSPPWPQSLEGSIISRWRNSNISNISISQYRIGWTSLTVWSWSISAWNLRLEHELDLMRSFIQVLLRWVFFVCIKNVNMSNGYSWGRTVRYRRHFWFSFSSSSFCFHFFLPFSLFFCREVVGYWFFSWSDE